MNLLCSLLGLVHVCGRADRDFLANSATSYAGVIRSLLWNARNRFLYTKTCIFLAARCVSRAQSRCRTRRAPDSDKIIFEFGPTERVLQRPFHSGNYKLLLDAAGSIMLKLAFTIQSNSKRIIDIVIYYLL